MSLRLWRTTPGAVTMRGMSTTSIALSGMNAAMLQLDVSAGNIANAQTPNYRKQAVENVAAPDGQGVKSTIVQTRDAQSSIEGDVVSQLAATYYFKANMKVLQTEERMMGSLLDARA
jgi:flagellar hook-associated protein FlgK